MKSVEAVCRLEDIVENSGRAVLVNQSQVAVFRLMTREGEKLFAIDNFCPFSKANVLSRGIVGSLKGSLVVASPIYKQHFDLQTGVCLEDESVRVTIWPVDVKGNTVFISAPAVAA